MLTLSVSSAYNSALTEPLVPAMQTALCTTDNVLTEAEKAITAIQLIACMGRTVMQDRLKL